MITWMQRHKKYLIITIWISTIAFVGAGFVGWGQYTYGDKAGAVAKVGNIEITMGELQKAYSNLYAQYNQMFQGNFDEEKAKMFGVQKQALNQLTNRALILNLAQSYGLRVSDKELRDELMNQEYFQKDGVFDKKIYKELLSRNNISIKEYETDLRKQLLIVKLFNLLNVQSNEHEAQIINTVLGIADKIEYKVLTDTNITITPTDDELHSFWEMKKSNFLTEKSYDVEYVKQEQLTQSYTTQEINEYYNANKTHFKDLDGKLLSLEDAKDQILAELDEKTTKDAALRKYIAFKKDKLEPNTKVFQASISKNEEFGPETLSKLSKASLTKPYLKPILVDSTYHIYKLLKIHEPQEKTYEQAKSSIVALYTQVKKQEKLNELALKTLENFSGITTDFITNTDSSKITKLNNEESTQFVSELFRSQQKKGIIHLSNNKVVLYNILEQKLLEESSTNSDDSIVKIKSAMFNEGVIKTLQNKYDTEIFVQGL